MADNREIYNTLYTAAQVDLVSDSPYDDYMIALRFALIREFGAGRDVLDLCCGTGAFLVPMMERFHSAVGLDFSSNMLDGLLERLGGRVPDNVRIVEADAAAIPLRDALFDFVYSYTSLYNVPDLERALCEVGRVLKPGGVAALELANSNSLAAVAARAFHEHAGWSMAYPAPLRTLRALLKRAGLEVVRHHAFQLLPLFGAPPALRAFRILATPRWKTVLGVRVGGRILDQWISGAWPLVHLAYRHLFVVRKP